MYFLAHFTFVIFLHQLRDEYRKFVNFGHSSQMSDGALGGRACGWALGGAHTARMNTGGRGIAERKCYRALNPQRCRPLPAHPVQVEEPSRSVRPDAAGASPYLQPIAPLDRVDPNRPQDGDDLPERGTHGL